MSYGDGENQLRAWLDKRRPAARCTGGPFTALIMQDLNKIVDIAQGLQSLMMNRIFISIIESYTLEELDSLAYGLGYPPSTLEGRTIDGRARSLIQHALNKHRLANLIDQIRDDRPHLEI